MAIKVQVFPELYAVIVVAGQNRVTGRIVSCAVSYWETSFAAIKCYGFCLIIGNGKFNSYKWEEYVMFYRWVWDSDTIKEHDIGGDIGSLRTSVIRMAKIEPFESSIICPRVM